MKHAQVGPGTKMAAMRVSTVEYLFLFLKDNQRGQEETAVDI